jgi:hypothetical protein
MRPPSCWPGESRVDPAAATPGRAAAYNPSAPVSANILHRAPAPVPDRAAPDPGGTAVDGRIGPRVCQRCASQQPRALRPRCLSHPRLAGHARRRCHALGHLPGAPGRPTGGGGASGAHGRVHARQIREELLPVIGRGATVLIADMAATIWCDHAGADASRPSRTAPPSSATAASQGRTAGWSPASAGLRPPSRPRRLSARRRSRLRPGRWRCRRRCAR